MNRQIILSIVFAIGVFYSIYEVIREWRCNKQKSTKATVTYKMKYYALWTVVFAYLIYMELTE